MVLTVNNIFKFAYGRGYSYTNQKVLSYKQTFTIIL